MEFSQSGAGCWVYIAFECLEECAAGSNGLFATDALGIFRRAAGVQQTALLTWANLALSANLRSSVLLTRPKRKK